MIKVLQKGNYRLVETPLQNKVLYLDDNLYTWRSVAGSGQMLELNAKPTKGDHVVSQGCYRLYDVQAEPELISQKHLELCVGSGKWQGFLLQSGLPASGHARSRIVPTQEVISNRTRAFA